MSSLAFLILDSTSFFISVIFKSLFVLITKFFSLPEDSSIAETNKIPSTSKENLTFILGIPAGLGSISDKINSPSKVFLLDVSLSP